MVTPKVVIEIVCVALLTRIVKEDVVAVAVLLSVTRIAIDCEPGVVGVPEIAPVEELRVRPPGRVPEASAKVFPPEPPDVLIDSAKEEL